MAYKIIWSPESIEDIENIAEFIARDSQFYADSVVCNIYETTQPLSLYPKLGRIVPE